VKWVAPPKVGEAVELTLFFLAPEGSVSWSQGQLVVDEGNLKNGTRVVLAARTREMPSYVSRDVEQFIKKAALRTKGRTDGVAAQLLWCRESGDALRTPFIFDLPVVITADEEAS
jgi:hypothetical protein